MTASKTVTPMGIWDVQGSFILPGTRDKVSFGPHRVVGPNKTIASAGLVETLNETFSKELKAVPRVAFQHVGFSKGFALMHLNWTPYVPKPDVKAVNTAQAIHDMCEEGPCLSPISLDDRTDPPALNGEA